MEVKFLIAGDCAVSIQMGNVISLEVNRQVRMLQEELETFLSLMIIGKTSNPWSYRDGSDICFFNDSLQTG